MGCAERSRKEAAVTFQIMRYSSVIVTDSQHNFGTARPVKCVALHELFEWDIHKQKSISSRSSILARVTDCREHRRIRVYCNQLYHRPPVRGDHYMPPPLKSLQHTVRHRE